MTWQIKLTEVAEKFLDKLYKSDKNAVVQINKKLRLFADAPYQHGKPLKGNKDGIWRYRVGNYRILCHLNNMELMVLVLEIGHRKEIYR